MDPTEGTSPEVDDESAEGEDPSSGKEDAARALLNSIKLDDAKGVAAAFASMAKLCSLSPDDEEAEGESPKKKPISLAILMAGRKK